MSKLSGTIHVVYRKGDSGFLDDLKALIARHVFDGVRVNLVSVEEAGVNLPNEYRLGVDAWSGVTVVEGSINARIECFSDLLHGFAGTFYGKCRGAIRWGSVRWCEILSCERWDGYETDVFSDPGPTLWLAVPTV